MLDGVMLLWFGLSAAAPLFVAVDISRSCSRRINFFLERRGWPGEWCDSFMERPRVLLRPAGQSPAKA